MRRDIYQMNQRHSSITRVGSIAFSLQLYISGKVYDGVMAWKHFPRNWPFVRGIQRSPVDSPHKGQWRGALMFSLNCAWMYSWVNKRGAGGLRRQRAHYDVSVMNLMNLNIA